MLLSAKPKHLGVDMFLLDDGWFANKYPRSSDHQGFGRLDGKPPTKLPNGIGKLTAEAKKNKESSSVSGSNRKW